MDKEMSDALRAPFAPEFVGQLPRISCAVCKKAPSKVCPSHKKIECKVCGNFITSAHIHLGYVGHADVTNRLLLVDPAWTYEPTTLDEFGRPGYSMSLDGQHALWIRLTVGGVTRLGVGLVPVDSDEIEKQLISDAIRNAAMRFGVALDLWSKAERLESAPTSVSENAVKPSVDVAPEVQSAVAVAPRETAIGAIDVVSYSPIVDQAEPLPAYYGDDQDYNCEFDAPIADSEPAGDLVASTPDAAGVGDASETPKEYHGGFFYKNDDGVWAVDFDRRHELWMEATRMNPTSTRIPTLFYITGEREIKPGSGEFYDPTADTEMVKRFAREKAEDDADWEARHSDSSRSRGSGSDEGKSSGRHSGGYGKSY